MCPFAAVPAARSFEQVPCPACDEPALEREHPGGAVGRVRCTGCGLAADAIVEVVVLADRRTRRGGCCAGFTRHELTWHAGEGEVGRTDFETWAQDHVMLAPGDRVTALFPAGSAGDARAIPYLAIDHDRGESWRLLVARRPRHSERGR